jgi:hypothetical protein
MSSSCLDALFEETRGFRDASQLVLWNNVYFTADDSLQFVNRLQTVCRDSLLQVTPEEVVRSCQIWGTEWPSQIAEAEYSHACVCCVCHCTVLLEPNGIPLATEGFLS